jgi:RHS repeat-associated protein
MGANYYPFGLSMAGISDKAIKPNYAENKYRFDASSEIQNKEFSDGSGLEMYETDFRGYDPQLGRFSQIDPLAPIFDCWSPYQYAYDNPIAFLDPSGADGESSFPRPCIACQFPSIDPNSSTVVAGPGNGGQNSDDNGGNGQSGDDQSPNSNNLPYFQTVSFNFGQSGSKPGRVNFSPSFEGGPRILPNSFRFKEPAKGDKSFRYSGVWGIPAIYETPDVHFVLEFGEEIWAPIEVRNWDFIERMNSHIEYPRLWAEGDIVETNTGYEFSRYAQAKIAADATDYASYQTSFMLATKQIISTTSYKAEFANQFRWYVRKFMPGTTMSILNTNIPGTTPAQFDSNSPNDLPSSWQH